MTETLLTAYRALVIAAVAAAYLSPRVQMIRVVSSALAMGLKSIMN